jgi:hypothetical protein
VLTDLDARRERHETDRSGRQEREQEVELGPVGDDRVHEDNESEIDEVVGERTHVAVAQLVLAQGLLLGFPHEPHASTPDHLVHVVALDLSAARHQTRGERAHGRLPRAGHSRHDDATRQLPGIHAP